MAAYEARPDLMRLLITNGASIDAPDRKGRTPVQCVLAPAFFDGESLVGKPTKTTPRQRLTLQVGHWLMLALQLSKTRFITAHLPQAKCCCGHESSADKLTVL